VLPPRQENTDYVRPPIDSQTYVPDVAQKLIDKYEKNKTKSDGKKSKKDKKTKDKGKEADK
jgi:hypothetical protein